MFWVTDRSMPSDQSLCGSQRAASRPSELAAPLPISTSYEPVTTIVADGVHVASPPARHPLVRSSNPASVGAYRRYAPRAENVTGMRGSFQKAAARASSNPTGAKAPHMVQRAKYGRDRRTSSDAPVERYAPVPMRTRASFQSPKARSYVRVRSACAPRRRMDASNATRSE